jgi:UDP-glucose-4-epimerase GalE
MIPKPKILITGGAGFIGSHTCKLLAQNGYSLVIVDNLSRGQAKVDVWGTLCKVDLNDFDRLMQVFQEHRPSAVVHFAALTYVGESMENPSLYYWNNVRGTLHLLEAMRQTACNQIVFSSTCATYGTPLHIPISESHPQNPINTYGQTKLMAETLLKEYGRAHAFRSVSLRYFNASGADPELELGECHSPETHLIPLALEAAAGMRPHLAVFGNDYPTPDGTCIRDYIHVWDLAQGHLQALRYLDSGGQTTAFNLGTGKGHSVQDVIRTAEQITGKKIPLQISARREGDPPILFADPRLALEKLEWKLQFPELKDQMTHAWKWLTR